MGKAQRAKEKDEKEQQRAVRRSAKEAKQAEKIKKMEEKLAKAKDGASKGGARKKATQELQAPAGVTAEQEQVSGSTGPVMLDNEGASSKPEGSPVRAAPEPPGVPVSEPEQPKKRRKTLTQETKEPPKEPPAECPEGHEHEGGGEDAAPVASGSVARKEKADAAFLQLKEAVEDPLIQAVELNLRKSFTLKSPVKDGSQIGVILCTQSFYVYKPTEKSAWGEDLQGYKAPRQ